jgi:hypothetical protein
MLCHTGLWRPNAVRNAPGADRARQTGSQQTDVRVPQVRERRKLRRQVQVTMPRSATVSAPAPQLGNMFATADAAAFHWRQLEAYRL